MNIAFADLVEGSETGIHEGANRPTRCLLRLSDDSLVAAVLKRLAPEGVLTEAFCALTLRRWGLHVPQPYLARLPEGGIAFASADESFPNLKQRLDWDDELPPDTRHELRVSGARIVSQFSQTPLAIAADEAIGNRDRHLANILWDGSNVAWIDHEACLGASREADRNRLVDLICLLGNTDPIKTSAVQSAHHLEAIPPVTCESLSEAYSDTTELESRLKAGLELLAQKVLARFPQPKDLLNQGHGN